MAHSQCSGTTKKDLLRSKRDELIRLAHTFLELANSAKSAKADFAPVLEAVTDMMKEDSEPVVQQQQQVQPPKKEE